MVVVPHPLVSARDHSKVPLPSCADVRNIDESSHSFRYRDRRLFAGMCSFWDSLLGNVTSALKAKPGVWDNTLLVVSSDNGGPVSNQYIF